ELRKFGKSGSFLNYHPKKVLEILRDYISTVDKFLKDELRRTNEFAQKQEAKFPWDETYAPSDIYVDETSRFRDLLPSLLATSALIVAYSLFETRPPPIRKHFRLRRQNELVNLRSKESIRGESGSALEPQVRYEKEEI
ncbi:MAG: hypothetical protein KAY24_08700, partial [Candidatus Eisenbacteria sp.]|nr:hypothetical protein [Candidatus Eisenbacteria bacterium]